MIDYVDTFDKFAVLKKLMIAVEHDLANDRPLSATQQAQCQRLMRMAEAECQALLSLILRIRGAQSVTKRHGQDTPVSWAAGFDPATRSVTLSSTDMFTNLSESFVMPPEEFSRLVSYLATVARQCGVGVEVGVKDGPNDVSV